MRKYIIIIIAIAISAGCSRPNVEPKVSPGDNSLTMAVLYNYYASEYKALAYQAYNIASLRIAEIADKTDDRSGLAVVVDIDETLLDNSPYQAKIVVDRLTYPEYWNEWCNLAIAKPVPGALSFLKLCDSLGFRIFYISNRKEDFVYDATFDNLKSAGFPQVSEISLLLRKERSSDNPDPANKESRRQIIRKMDIEIVMLVGDNLGDFYEDQQEHGKRDASVKQIKEKFGSEFIMIPNAMYGNWPASIGIDGSSDSMLKLLKEMAPGN